MFFFEEVNSKFFQTSKLNGFQIPHIFGRHVFVGIFFQSLSSRPSYRIALEKRERKTRNTSTLSKLSSTTLKREDKSSASLRNCWMIGFFWGHFQGRCLWSEEIMAWKWRWCKTPKFMIESQSYWGSVLANASQLAHKANCQLPFSWYFGSTVEALENRKQINTLCQPIAYIGSNPQVHSDKWRFIQISLLKNVWLWQIQSFKLDSNGWLGSPTAGGNKGANFLTLIQEVLQLHTAMLETMEFTM